MLSELPCSPTMHLHRSGKRQFETRLTSPIEHTSERSTRRHTRLSPDVNKLSVTPNPSARWPKWRDLFNEDLKYGLTSCRHRTWMLSDTVRTTKLEVQFIVNQLARQMQSPTEHHLEICYKVISFLYAFRNKVIKFCDNMKGNNLHVYTDASTFQIETLRNFLSCNLIFFWSLKIFNTRPLRKSSFTGCLLRYFPVIVTVVSYSPVAEDRLILSRILSSSSIFKVCVLKM